MLSESGNILENEDWSRKMGKSFQDQLLKAGLVNKQQLNQSKSSKHKQKKQKKTSQTVEQQQKSLNEQELTKQSKDKQLNLQLQSERLQKALAGEIKQLIMANIIVGEEEAEITYNFSDQGIIKKIVVSPQIQKDLAADRLQIVRHNGSYVVISSATAEIILQRDANYAVIKNQQIEAQDDDYAGYDVPDDLIW